MNGLLKKIDREIREARIRRVYADLVALLDDYDSLLAQDNAPSIQLQLSGWGLFLMRESAKRFEEMLAASAFEEESDGHRVHLD